MNPFPVDIWSIKEYGIEAWHQAFFWPVTNPEMRTLHAEIDRLYLHIVTQSPPDVADAFWVLYSWVSVGISELIHQLMVVQRLQRQGLSIANHPSTGYYQALIEGNAIENLIGKPLPKLSSWPRKRRGQLRVRIETLKRKGFDLAYYFNSSGQPPYLATNYSSQRLNEFSSFAASHGREISIVHPVELMPTSLKRTESLAGSQQIFEYFIDELENIVSRHDIQIGEKQLNSLRNLFINSLHYIADYTESIVKILASKNPTTIFVNAIGNIFKRCLCIAGKRTGFQMVGFTHGKSSGIFKTKYFSHIEQSMVDVFVVPSKGAVELFSLSAQKFLLPYGKDVQIVANMTGSSYTEIKQNTRAASTHSSIASVMLIEYPLRGPFSSGSYVSFWAYQFDFNLRLAMQLREEGITTILKRHPDRLGESEGVYDRYYDELLVEPFESVYDRADAYLFPNITTTTFGFALLTNKPVIIFETSLEDVWESASELLRKRCRVIPSWVAEDGRLMFDEAALVAALRQPPEEPNDEFIERYMLS